jgi:23S rRNA-/tRNA-specific pseudouridylate synthase
MRKRVFTIALGDPDTLAQAVAARLRLELPEAAARCAGGAVWVDGRRQPDGSVRIARGAKVAVHDADATPPTGEIVPVYRDGSLIVVDKPAGLPSQATRADAADTLEARVQQAFGEEARMMHRLDRDASGLVLFALDPRARAPLLSAT